MATTTSIPRFLLPQSSALWRGLVRTANPPRTGTSAGRVTLRFASSTSSKTGKPAQRVLEKPERFNPPSHGARLPRRNELPRHYGGDLTKEEVLAQIKKEYPGLMAPGGTLAYRIIYSKWIHLTITMGALTSLAIWTWRNNLERNSPYADMLPSGSDFLWHPLSSLRMLVEVIRLDELHTSAQVAEKRARHVDDVAKRTQYRKAHGLPEEQGFASMFGLGKAKEEASEAAVVAAPGTEAAAVVVAEGTPEQPRKKFLGIF